jgi:hypothetical protein
MRNSRAAFAIVVGIALAPRFASAGDDECDGFVPQPLWCFQDIACAEYSEYWDVKRSVVHIYGPDINGTGVLINNKDCALNEEGCNAPYVLTASHVFASWNQPPTENQIFALENETLFTVGFENVFCGGDELGDAIAVDQAILLKVDPEKDLALLQLSTTIPVMAAPYFMGWDSTPQDLFSAAAITHPCNGPKRISVVLPDTTVYQEAVGVNWYRVQFWEAGETSPGSSGGPLLTEHGELLGICSRDAGKNSLQTCAADMWKTDDVFVAMSSILSFLPHAIGGGLVNMDPFDADPDSMIPSLLQVSDEYIADTSTILEGSVEVRLIDGFHAYRGSEIIIRVKP